MRRRRRRTRVLVRRGGRAGWSPRVPERRRCRGESRKRSREPRGSPPPRPRRAARAAPRRRGTRKRFGSNRLHRRRQDARVGGCRGRVAVELGKRRRGSARFGQRARLSCDARAVLSRVVRHLLFLPEVPGSSPADAPRPRRGGGFAARGVARARRKFRRRAEIFPRRESVFSRWSSSHAERRRLFGVLVVSFSRKRRRSPRRRIRRVPDATRRALLGFRSAQSL